jgi:hypothetical protein
MSDETSVGGELERVQPSLKHLKAAAHGNVFLRWEMLSYSARR